MPGAYESSGVPGKIVDGWRKNANPRALALTMGDARGIGPEVLLKALADKSVGERIEPVIVGVEKVLRAEASRLWPEESAMPGAVGRALERVVDIPGPDDDLGDGDDLRPRLMDNPRLCGAWAGKAVERAVDLVKSGRTGAIVTAPVDKHALNLAGYNFPGHTEMLAHLAGDRRVSMMLVGGSLRVAAATTHIPLARVAGAITVDLLLGHCRIVHRGLRDLFGIPNPRIALCGLNPHLGDGGLAGDEDRTVLAPAAGAARAEGIQVSGPYPADTVFMRARDGEFDAVLAMYHDQAMIPVKMHAFGKGVNVTLGLPFVRTSPDHGTALDIAGQGCARAESMIEAVLLAAALAEKYYSRSQ